MSDPTQDEITLRAKVSSLEDRIFTLLEKSTEDPLKLVMTHEALLLLRDAVILRRNVLNELSRLVAVRLKKDQEWIKERYGDKPYH
jgi:hypothetical protein